MISRCGVGVAFMGGEFEGTGMGLAFTGTEGTSLFGMGVAVLEGRTHF